MTDNENNPEKNIDTLCENVQSVLNDTIASINDNNTEEVSLDKKEELKKVILDFTNDIKNTFPEYDEQINNLYENDELKIDEIFDHCSKLYPERFFDILYKNEEIMKDENINCHFLPDIDFKKLWFEEGISDSIKDTLWKYLQVILFTLIKDIDNKSAFGDTTQLFEAINNDDFKNKMEETMKNIQDMFFTENSDDEEDEEDEEDNNEINETQEGITNESDNNDGSKKKTNSKKSSKKHPFLNPEMIHEHLSKLMDGKLGRLATEIAEETAKDLDIDLEGSENTESIMKNLMNNPKKLMDLVKKVGGKLDSKIKSGDIKESELMDEAGNIMKMMENMPGMKDMGKMFKNMGIPGLGKNTKINTNAFKTRMKKEDAINKMRERAKEKVRKMEEEKKLQETYEQKRKEFMGDNTQEKSIEELMQQLGLNEEPQNEIIETNKPKKKKSKKPKKPVTESVEQKE